MKGDDRLDGPGMLLLRVASGARSEIERAICALSDAEWNTLVARACEFRMGPLLLQVVSEQGWKLPGKALAELDRDRREQTFRALSQRRTLASLAIRMNRLGFDHVVLKGGALVMSAPRNIPVTRLMRDLDVLLSPEDANALHADLQQRGWTIPAGLLREAEADSHHLPALADPENGNIVELHLRLIKKPWPGEDRLQSLLWTSPKTATCLGEPVRLAAPAANFLHLLAHGTLNRPFDPGPQFLADMRTLIDGGGMDPAALRSQLAELGLTRAFTLTLAMIGRLAGPPGPEWLLAETPGDETPIELALQASLSQQGLDREHRFKEDRKRSGTAFRWLLASLRRAVSPSAESLADISGRNPDDLLRYLGYPRWIARRLRAMASAVWDPSLDRDAGRTEALRAWLNGESAMPMVRNPRDLTRTGDEP